MALAMLACCVRGQVQLTCNDTVTICSASETCCCPVPLNLCACCITGVELCNNGVCELPSVSPTPTSAPTLSASPSAPPSPTPSPSPLCASPSPTAAGYYVVTCGRVAVVINSTSSNRTLVVDPDVVVEGSVQLESAVVVVPASVNTSAGGVSITGADSQLFINNTALVILGPPPSDGDFVELFTVESGNITVGSNVTIQFEGDGNSGPSDCERRTATTQRRGNTLGVLFSVDSSACGNSGGGKGLAPGSIVAIVVSVACCLAIVGVVCGTVLMCFLFPRLACLKRTRERSDSNELVSQTPLVY
jgi:hypothetical protein